MMRIVQWCLFACGSLHLCSAFEMNCNVTQYPDQTVYSISDEFRVSDIGASDCHYSYTSDRVIANHKENIPGLVKSNTANDLVTYKCFASVTFKRTCLSEGKGFVAYCTINCTHDALRFQKHEVGRKKDGGGKKEQEQGEAVVSQNITGVAVGVAVAVTVILGLVVLGLLCYKLKDKIARAWSRSTFRCIYSSVMMQNIDPQAVDLEARN